MNNYSWKGYTCYISIDNKIDVDYEYVHNVGADQYFVFRLYRLFQLIIYWSSKLPNVSYQPLDLSHHDIYPN